MHCLPITQTGEAGLHKGDEISKLVTVMSASIHSQSKNSDVCGNSPQCKENKTQSSFNQIMNTLYFIYIYIYTENNQLDSHYAVCIGRVVFRTDK